MFAIRNLTESIRLFLQAIYFVSMFLVVSTDVDSLHADEEKSKPKEMRIVPRSKDVKTISPKIEFRCDQFYKNRFTNSPYAIKIGNEIFHTLQKDLGKKHPFLIQIRICVNDLEKEKKLSREQLKKVSELHKWITNSNKDMFVKNNPQNALKIAEQKLNFAKQIYGESSDTYLSALKDKMQVLYYLGKIDKAVAEFKYLLALTKKIYGENSQDYSVLLSKYAIVYVELNANNAKILANQFLVKSYNLYQNIYDYDVAENQELLETLIHNAFDLKDYRKQVEYLSELIRIAPFSNLEGEKLAAAHFKLGRSYRSLGNYRAAIQQYKIAVEQLRKSPLDELAVMHVYADIYDSELLLGNWKQAVNHIDAIILYCKNRGYESQLEACMANKSIALIHLGKKENTEKILLKYYSTLVKLIDNKEGANKKKSDFISNSNRIVYYYVHEKKYLQAKRCALLSYKKLDRKLKENYPFTYMECVESLGYSHLKLGELEKAEKYLKEAMSFSKPYLHQKHPHYATQLAKLGELRLAQGKLDDAEKSLSAARSILEETMGKKFWRLPAIIELQAQLAKKQNQTAAALEAKAKKIRKEHANRYQIAP